MAKVKVRLLTALSGPAGTHSAGEVIALDADDAKDYIERGYGEAVAVKREARSEKRSAK